MVKPAAFLPNPRNDETSVFRHCGEPLSELWDLGGEYIRDGRSLHGVAIVTAKVVRAASLDVAASEPPPRHANIINWPAFNADPELTKAERKKFAALIAQHATLERC